MFTKQRLSGLALTVAASALLAGCGTTSLSTVHDGQTDSPVWPAMEAANPLIPATVHPDIASLRKIAVGTPKLEVYKLIGHPMYREGLVGVHEWNYLFKFPGSDGAQEITCQYKVLFDDAMLAHQTFWNPAACADLVGPVEAAAPPASATPHVVAATEMSADFLFDFDSAVLAPGAAQAIDQKVIEVLDKAEHVEALRVIGFTDRLGSDAYNQVLSERRAQAVKRYLASRGVPAEAVLVVGRGAAEPVVECPGAKSASVVACLAPNRRVRIEVVAR
jgi:outer membrane protein OmpA-like peptidoglycan-associated protein